VQLKWDGRTGAPWRYPQEDRRGSAAGRPALWPQLAGAGPGA